MHKRFILILSGNDGLKKIPNERIAANLKKMIKLIQDGGSQVVLIATPCYGIGLRVPSFYKKIGREFDIPVDTTTIRSIMKDKSKKSDWVHFNKQGYRELAESIEALLKNYGTKTNNN